MHIFYHYSHVTACAPLYHQTIDSKQDRKAYSAIWGRALVIRPESDLCCITQCIGLDLGPHTWSRISLFPACLV